MAKYESYVKMINARLKEVYNYFGEKSPEYQDLASATFSVMGQENVLLSINLNKPIKVIRSKKANEINPLLYQDMQDIWRMYSDYGTLRQMIYRKLENYRDELGEDEITELKKMWNSPKKIMVNYNEKVKEVTGKEYVEDFIKKVSRQEYNYRYDDNELYENVQELITNMYYDDNIDDNYKNQIRGIWETFHKNGKGIKDTKFDEIRRKWDKLNDEYEIKIKEELGIQTAKDIYDLGYNE